MPRAGGAAALILATQIAGTAFAQDYGAVAPKEPKPATPGEIRPPPLPAQPQQPAASNKQLLPELEGLQLVDDPKKIVRNGVKFYGIKIDPALTPLDDGKIRNRLAQFIGKPLFTGDLQTISRLIVAWCRAHDFPLTEVTFPEQDISSGTVQIVVTIYRVGHVKVSGNRWFSDSVLTDEMQLTPGDPFDFGVLKDDLDRLDRNPFRQVDAVLERSSIPGTTDLALHVQDRLPLRVYGSYDNDGLPVSGRDRYSFGLNWGNVFGFDQQFSYQFTTSPDIWQRRERGVGHSDDPRLAAHSATYLVPLPWSDTVTLFGTYEQQVPNLGANFDQVGHSLQMSFRYDKFLPTIRAFSEQLHFGFDYKRSNNNLAFGGSEVFADATNIEQFLLIYDATRKDSYGQTSLEGQFVYSPGGLSPGNRTSVFVASGVAGSKANYNYESLQVTRITALPAQMTAILRLTGQLASTELLPSEQLGAGGPDSVRGYDPRVADGSQGVLASFELHSPSYGPLDALGWNVGDAGQVLAFYDAGNVSDFHTQSGQPRHAFLQSTGVGVRYDLGRYLDVRFDDGWQLARAPGKAKTGNLANIAVTFGY